MYIKSPLVYWGSKKRILSQIFEIFPKNINRFFDCFGGSGVVSWNVKSNEVFYNEINKDIVSIIKWIYETPYEKLKKDIFELMDKFELTNFKYKTENFYKKTFNFKMLEQLKNEKKKYKKFLNYSLQFEKNNPLYIYIWYSLSAFYQLEKKENNELGKTIIIIKLKIWKEWMSKKKIHFSSLDCIDFIKSFDFKTDDFLYLDPPYLKTDCSAYENNYSFSKQEILFETLENLKIKWAMSNVNNNDDEALKNWILKNKYIENKLDLIYTFGKNLNQKEQKNNNEILITNYQKKPVSFKIQQLKFFEEL